MWFYIETWKEMKKLFLVALVLIIVNKTSTIFKDYLLSSF